MGEIGNDKENLRAINDDSKKEDLRIDVEDEEEEKGDAGDAVDDEYEGRLKDLSICSTFTSPCHHPIKLIPK
ncbi:hypothetical protein HZH66_014823 [Vespula vulgaris]|uniref:Uncharacterized protein n=1 Tax=Vespula vulgaris TaxID=7454 RepID=A0A834J2H1_VESVU|nr:hypothetical protein HZH66_014823 [Vespula vulgaris]